MAYLLPPKYATVSSILNAPNHTRVEISVSKNEFSVFFKGQQNETFVIELSQNVVPCSRIGNRKCPMANG